MFGLTFDKLLIVGFIAAMLIGPSRLPAAAAWLRQFTRRLAAFATGAQQRLRDEVGDEFDDIDWKKLDPRQYDPRQIIREALSESTASTATPATAAEPQREKGATDG